MTLIGRNRIAKTAQRRVRARRGSVYLAVLGTSLVATTLLAGALYVQQAKLRADRDAADGEVARQAAESGIEFARAWMAKTPTWRNAPIVNLTNNTLGNARFDVQITDPTDGDVADRPYDPVVVTSTARVGRAEQSFSANFTASPVAHDSLGYALHTNEKLIVVDRLIVGAATVSVNNQVENYATIEGNAITKRFKATGTITGTRTTTNAVRSMPTSAVAEWYAGFGTSLAGVRDLDKRLLTPDINPLGASNPEGVYVIRSSNDVTIRNCRVYGTLVVICPGRKVTIDNNVLLQSASPDMPALIVVGDVEAKYITEGQTLSEANLDVNFNPPGAAYNGITDTDKADVYPSEIHGLVHVTGAYAQSSYNTLRGVVLSTDDASISGVHTIVRDPSLFAWPPMGYAARVNMPMTAGSLQRTVK